MEAIKGTENIKFLIDVPLQLRCDMCFQRDGALLRFAIKCTLLDFEL
jgi:hypothetical protein